MSEHSIRAAMLQDVGGIAAVHVESWHTTYEGLLPPEVIAERTVERRTRAWAHILSAADPESRTFIAEESGRITAFAHFGPTRSPELPFTHELFAIYSLQEVHGRGIGTALVRAGAGWLDSRGARSMMLWVLESNTLGRGFYDRLGGRVVGRRIDPISTVLVHELAYGWDDLAALLKMPNSPAK